MTKGEGTPRKDKVIEFAQKVKNGQIKCQAEGKRSKVSQAKTTGLSVS